MKGIVLIPTSSGSIENPPEGSKCIFLDTDHQLKTKDYMGNVSPVNVPAKPAYLWHADRAMFPLIELENYGNASFVEFLANKAKAGVMSFSVAGCYQWFIDTQSSYNGSRINNDDVFGGYTKTLVLISKGKTYTNGIVEYFISTQAEDDLDSPSLNTKTWFHKMWVSANNSDEAGINIESYEVGDDNVKVGFWPNVQTPEVID